MSSAIAPSLTALPRMFASGSGWSSNRLRRVGSFSLVLFCFLGLVSTANAQAADAPIRVTEMQSEVEGVSRVTLNTPTAVFQADVNTEVTFLFNYQNDAADDPEDGASVVLVEDGEVVAFTTVFGPIGDSSITYTPTQAGISEIEVAFEGSEGSGPTIELFKIGTTIFEPINNLVLPASSEFFLESRSQFLGAFVRHGLFYSRGIPFGLSEGVPYLVGDKTVFGGRLYEVVTPGTIGFGEILLAGGLSSTDPTTTEVIDGVEFRYIGPNLIDGHDYVEGDYVVSNGNIYQVVDGGRLNPGEAAFGLTVTDPDVEEILFGTVGFTRIPGSTPMPLVQGLTVAPGDYVVSSDGVFLAEGAGTVTSPNPRFTDTDPNKTVLLDGIPFRFVFTFELREGTYYWRGDTIFNNGELFEVTLPGAIAPGGLQGGLDPAQGTEQLKNGWVTFQYIAPLDLAPPTYESLVAGQTYPEGQLVISNGRIYETSTSGTLASLPTDGLQSENDSVPELVEGRVGFTLFDTVGDAPSLTGQTVSPGEHYENDGRVYVVGGAGGPITSASEDIEEALVTTNPNAPVLIDGVSFTFVPTRSIVGGEIYEPGDLVFTNFGLFNVTTRGTLDDSETGISLSAAIPGEQFLKGVVGFLFKEPVPVRIGELAPWQWHKYELIGGGKATPFSTIWKIENAIDDPINWFGPNGYNRDNTRVEVLARGIDGRYRENLSAPLSLVVTQPVAPIATVSVAITSPTDGRTVAASTEVPISAVARDINEQSKFVEGVRFYVDGVELGDGDATFPYGIPTDETPAWIPTTAGTYVLHAVAIDLNGNRTLSPPVTVNVTDNQPQVQLLSPLGTFAAPMILNDGQVLSLSAQAVGSGGVGNRIVSVQFFSDGNLIADGVFDGNRYWTANAVASTIFETNRIYTITARATDSNGIVGESVAQFIRVESRPGQAPSVSIDPPVAASVLRGETVALTGLAGDADGTVASVAIYANGARLPQDAQVNPDGTFEFSWVPTATGNFDLVAIATDDIGLSTPSAPVSVTVVEGTKPVVALDEPVSTSVQVDTPITLTGTTADADGTVVLVEVFANGTSLGTVTPSAGAFSISWTPSVVGPYTVEAVAIDSSGLFQTSAPLALTVVDGTPPEVTLDAPVSSTVRVGTTVSLTGRAGDADGTVSGVNVFANGTLLGAATLNPNGTFSFEWIPTLTGPYSVEAVATDSSNLTQTSAPLALTVVDGTPPVVTLDEPVSSTVRVDSNVTLTGTFDDADGTVTTVRIFANAVEVGIGTLNPNGTFFFVWTPSIVGPYSIEALATDDVGLTQTSAPLALTVVDGTPPVVTLDAPISTTVPAGTTVSLTGRASDADGTVSGVNVFANGTLLGAATLNPDGTFSFEWIFTALGTFTIDAVATDNDGLTGRSGTVDIFVPSPITVAGFGELLPDGLDPNVFVSEDFGPLTFPGGDPNGMWAFSRSLDSWLGRTADDRIWSMEFGFLDPTGVDEEGTRSFESSIFGPISVPIQNLNGPVIWFLSDYIKWVAKFKGTSFFWSDLLNGYLQSTSEGGLWSFSWQWIRPVTEWLIDSSLVGRVYLSGIKGANPLGIPGGVYNAETGQWFYP